MNAFTTLAVLFLFGLVSARDNRLSEECLRGIADRNKCCEGVPDAWLAHLKNRQDCTKFYQCEHGQATSKDCPSNLHWSVEADECDWPSAANCTVERPEEPTTSAPTEGRPTSSTAAPTTTGPPPPPPILPEEDICAPEPVCHQCLNGVFPADLCCRDVQTYHKLNLADAKNCSWYFQCVNGNAIHRQCPDGLQWSANTDRCEWPSVAQCQSNNGTGNESGNGSGNGGGNGSGNGGGNTGNEGGNNNGGNNDGNGVVSSDCLSGKVSAVECCRGVPYWVDVLLQNNADCHTFIQCVHQKPVVRPCPANLRWSITRNRCEWDQNATCTW